MASRALERTTASPTILLLGATGQVGKALVGELAPVGKLVAPSRHEASLDRPESLVAVMRHVMPDIVVNAAAYTAVDAAEVDRERCMRANAVAPGVLAVEAARAGCPVIHYSTNYVFDGVQKLPYREEDPISPCTVYGESKALGESAIASANGAHVILRTSAVYSWTGSNFMLRMRELAAQRDELRVVDDQFVSPTPAAVVAYGTRRVIDRLMASDGDTARGLYHLTTTGACSWYEFARAILAQFPPDRQGQACRLMPVPSSDFPTPARRPLNGVLDTSLFEQRFRWRPPTWKRGLQATFAMRS